MLSRKYYRDLALIISVSSSKEDFIKRLVNYLVEDNPNFDKNKFFYACDYLSRNQHETQT